MTPPDDHDAPDQDLYEETPPRSIFAATWFRALLVLIVLGVIGAVAVPYILDAMNPPAPKPTVASRTPASPPAVSTPPPSSSSTSSASSASSTPALPPASVAPAITDKASERTAMPVEKTDKTEKSDTKAVKSDKADRSDKVGVATARPADKAVDKTTPDKTEKKDAMVASATTSETKPVTTAKPAAKTTTAKPPTPAKSETTKSEETATPAVAAKTTPAPATKRVAAKATPPSAPKATESGDWWVQVGAFRDAETAKKVAAKLRDQNYKVDESLRAADTDAAAKSTAPAAKSTGSDKPATAAPAGSDQYDVFVSGGSAADLNKRLSGKGLAAEPSGAGVVVKPSLPLRDAVALSKDLAIEGFKVQVRRTGGTPDTAASRPAAPEKPAAGTGGGESLHRVRVGGFADRATAMTALKELEGKGYKPFLTRR